MKEIKYWIIGIIVLLILGLSFYAGRKSVKCPTCPDITEKDSSYSVPLPPTTAHLEIVKPGKPVTKDSDIVVLVGELDSLSNPPAKLPNFYSELIDTTILLKEDSLDFVAEIVFNDSLKSFSNTFDFWIRAKQKIREVVKYVEVPMKPEIYQHPLVIILSIAVSFLLGLTIGG